MKQKMPLIGLVFCSILVLAVIGCSILYRPYLKQDGENYIDVLSKLGWDPSIENFDNVAVDLFYGAKSDFAGNPNKVILTSPPARSQGSYGTCVAFSIGYYFRTINRATHKGNPGLAMDEANQFSPKDLWYSIPAGSKGEGCGGTSLGAAFEQLVSRGVSTWKSVPYENIICSASPKFSWTMEAGNYKLASYRRIPLADDAAVKDKIKAILAAGKPLSFASGLKEPFGSWKLADGPLKAMPGAEIGGHAMTLIGFDNTINAFRVQNSWGAGWGDEGGIWVDQDYFVNGFSSGVIIAYEIGEQSAPSGASAKAIDLYSGVDVTDLSISMEDLQVTFSAETSGMTDIPYTFFYYNSLNGFDRDTLVSGTIGGDTTIFDFQVPENLDGEYYFALAIGNRAEYFIFDTEGLPVSISGGTVTEELTAAKTGVTDAAPNAYTPEEISYLIAQGDN